MRTLGGMLTDLVEATFGREDGDVAIVTSSSSSTHDLIFWILVRVSGFGFEEGKKDIGMLRAQE